MPAVKTKRISTLIESQLPAFITSEYELFSKFVQKYYEAQEVQGGTLDVINNIQKYADIDYYEKNLLKQNDKLTANVAIDATTITVEDAQSFPKKTVTSELMTRSSSMLPGLIPSSETALEASVATLHLVIYTKHLNLKVQRHQPILVVV